MLEGNESWFNSPFHSLRASIMHLLGKSKYKDKVLSRISEVQYMDGASRKLMDVNESAIGMVEGHWDSSTLGSRYFLVFFAMNGMSFFAILVVVCVPSSSSSFSNS